MSSRLRIEAAAKEELAAAIAWYEEQRPGLGGELLDEVDATFLRILEGPDMSTPVPACPPDLPARRLFVKRFPYSVVFLESGQDVLVIAVAHLKQKPGYWLSRTA